MMNKLKSSFIMIILIFGFFLYDNFNPIIGNESLLSKSNINIKILCLTSRTFSCFIKDKNYMEIYQDETLKTGNPFKIDLYVNNELFDNEFDSEFNIKLQYFNSFNRDLKITHLKLNFCIKQEVWLNKSEVLKFNSSIYIDRIEKVNQNEFKFEFLKFNFSFIKLPMLITPKDEIIYFCEFSFFEDKLNLGSVNSSLISNNLNLMKNQQIIRDNLLLE